MSLKNLATLLFLVAVASAAPRDDKKDYRLKKNFKPVSYEVTFDIPEEVLTTPDKNLIENAEVKVVVKKPEIDPKDKVFNFHMDKKYIDITQIKLETTTSHSLIDVKDMVHDDDTQIAAIKLPEEITDPTFILTFTYNFNVSNPEMFGLYKSKYTVDDKEEYLLATQFESVYARRVFPCLDEPAFKATFKLKISTKAPGYKILTNTQLLTKPEEAKDSPIMSTYLVAIIVSKFTESNGVNGADGTVHKVWSRDELSMDRKLAAFVGPKALDLLGKKLGINFHESGLTKMDQIAIPDFDAGAMENWGLVTFRENALLFNTQESSTSAKMRVFEVITHEFTHQWFGDLVTLDWWDVTFLNEGFANFFEYHITNELYPEYKMDNQFVVNVLQSALDADAAPEGKALQSECNTKAEIQAKFDDISYNKGASIINMVKHYISVEELLKGLNKYLSSHKFQNVRPEDLWKALNTDKINMTNIMHDWINEPGFPLIHVSYKDKKVTVSQKKFTLANDGKASSWKVPIKYKYSVSGKAPVETVELLEEKTKDIAVDNLSWVHLENAQGFYRVNYDEDLWKHLTDAIAGNNTKISDIDQSQIVDDLFTLGRINELPYSDVFNHIKFLEKSNNYFVWVPAFKGFDFLLKRFGGDTELGKKISGTVLGNMKSVKELPEATNDPIEKLRLGLTYNWLCRLKDEKSVKDAETKFANYIKEKDSEAVDPDLRSAVYCYGQKDDKDWDKLFENYKKTKVAAEKDVILNALACTKSSKKIKQLFDLSLQNKEIRAQDGRTVFQAVLTHDVDSALDFFKKNHKAISETYSGISLSDLVTSLADRLTTDEQVKVLSDLSKDSSLNAQFKVVLESAIKVAKANLSWKKKAEEQLRKYYGLGGGANSIQLSISCILAITLAVVYNLF